MDILQKKISELEVENKSLRAEAAEIAKETDEIEEQERRLMADIKIQLNSSNSQFDGLNLELERYKEENRLQYEQITSLTKRLEEAEMRLHQVTLESEEQCSALNVTRQNQDDLAFELAEFKSRYEEVLALLRETQEELRKQRKRTQVRSSVIPGLLQSSRVAPADSLQSELRELESSHYSDNSLDSGIASDRGASSMYCGSSNNVFKKVFETVKCATKTGNFADPPSGAQLGSMTMSSYSQPRMSSFASGGYGQHRSGTMYSSSTYPTYGGSAMGARTYSKESLISDSEDSYPAQAPAGIPGAPGAKDLEAALKRLTPAEISARRANLTYASTGLFDESGAPMGVRTPDSIMSTGSSGLSLSTNQWRLPDKLQIVKPMEGSQTLGHWSRLATPTLSGLLEERPGVQIRGGRGLDELGLQTHSLSDVEEDYDDNPGKSFQHSGCIYTFTNSMVMHPDDGTSVTFSVPPSQMSSLMTTPCSSRQSR